MLDSNVKSHGDVWAQWLLQVRHGNNFEHASKIQPIINGIADRVLDAANIKDGMTIVDVGTGDGLVAFRAIDRFGKNIQVILTDISAPLLQHAKKVADKIQVKNQCRFLQCSAESLQEIEDASVDVVMTRAVLAYVSDKEAALREFYRILKPGGRISFSEPILRDEALIVNGIKKAVDSFPDDSGHRFIRLFHRWKSAQFPDTFEKISASPLTNFNERDLIHLTQNAKFSDVHLELHIDVFPTLITSWEIFINSSPHPLAPTLRTILAQQFTEEEQEYFELILRPEVENGKSLMTDRIAYLNAKK